MTVRRDFPVDFGVIEEGKFFRPSVRAYPNKFDGFLVGANEAVRYGFEIVSDHFVSSQPHVFEGIVEWEVEQEPRSDAEQPQHQ